MRKHAWLQTDASIRTAASIIFYVCALRAAEASQNANRSDFAIPDYDIYHKRCGLPSVSAWFSGGGGGGGGDLGGHHIPYLHDGSEL